MGNDPLGPLREFLAAHDLSPRETERMGRDVAVILERLGKGLYRQTDFSGANRFNVPERTEEFVGYLREWCLNGETWARIFEAVSITTYDRVVDLCCGWAPKVCLGLFYTGYHGEVTLLDQNPDFPGRLRQALALFHPAFSFREVIVDLASGSVPALPCVVGNHVIDDLLLQRHCDRSGCKVEELYAKENAIRNAWDAILAAPETEECTAWLAEIFTRVTMPGGLLLLSQYRAMMEDLLGLDRPVELCIGLLNSVAERLVASGEFSDKSAIATTALHGFHGAFTAEECKVLQRRG